MRMYLSGESCAIEVFSIYLANRRQATKPKSIETLHDLARAWRSGRIQMKVRHTEGDALSPCHVPDGKRWSRWIVCLLLLSCFCRIDPASGSERPNVVLILADDQSYRDFGFMGNDLVHTPHLDELARTSARYPNGYTPMSVCRPSLATLLTGLYPHQHGIHFNHPPPGLRAMRDLTGEQYRQTRATTDVMITRVPTLPRILARHGYACLQTGKHWEGSYKTAGFTDGMTLAKPSTRLSPITGTRQQENGVWVAHGNGDSGLTIGRETMKPIERFVADHAGERPFMVWYAPFLPHTPHTPPKRLLDKYTKPDRPKTMAKYYAMCDWFDETCGQLRDILGQHKVADNTLIVYVTDNGWIQNPERNGYAPRSKQTPYEGGIRTPIIFHWPKRFKPADRPELVSSIDLVPTLLAVAGTRKPKIDLPGLNLHENLRSGSAIDRKTIYGESFAHDIADIEDPQKSLLFRWCIEGRWKLLLTYDGEVNRYKTTHPRTEKRPQLFDLLADPAEEKNLAKANPKVVAAMAKKLEQWYATPDRKVLTKY